MSTPYSDIFKRAVFRFKDYDYLRMSNDQIHEVMTAFLHSAISDFGDLGNWGCFLLDFCANFRSGAFAELNVHQRLHLLLPCQSVARVTDIAGFT